MIQLLKDSKDKEEDSVSIGFLFEATGGPDMSDQGIAAAEALGMMGEAAKDAVPVLIQEMQVSYMFDTDRNAKIRRAVAEALGSLGAKEAVPQLMEKLKNDKDNDDRWASARALGAMGAKEAIPVLIEWLHSKEISDRQVAADALGELGANEAVPHLIEWLQKKTHPGYREVPLQTLIKLGPLYENKAAILQILNMT